MINSPAGLRQFFSSVDCIFIYCLRLLSKRVLHIINIRKLPKWDIEDPPILSHFNIYNQYILTDINGSGNMTVTSPAYDNIL